MWNAFDTGEAWEVESPESVLGRRLKAFRQQRGLKLRQLAEMSGLSVNTLSMVEHGRTSPSLSTLQVIARTLDLPLRDLFAAEPARQMVHFVPSSERRTAKLERIRLEYMGGDLRGQTLQPFIVTLVSGAGSGDRMVVHTGCEFIHCLSGELLCTVGEEHYRLQPGDSLLFESHLPHSWRNDQAWHASFMLVLAPADEHDMPADSHFPL